MNDLTAAYELVLQLAAELGNNDPLVVWARNNANDLARFI